MSWMPTSELDSPLREAVRATLLEDPAFQASRGFVPVLPFLVLATGSGVGAAIGSTSVLGSIAPRLTRNTVALLLELYIVSTVNGGAALHVYEGSNEVGRGHQSQVANIWSGRSLVVPYRGNDVTYSAAWAGANTYDFEISLLGVWRTP